MPHGGEDMCLANKAWPSTNKKNKLIPKIEVRCDGKDILKCKIHVHVHSIHLIWTDSTHKLLETMVQVMVYNSEGWKLSLSMVMSFTVPRWHGMHIWSPATPIAWYHIESTIVEFHP